jgi:acyl carrier protein
MSAQSVSDQVIAILAAQALCDPARIDPEATIESLGLDSLALVEAIFAIEETFGVQVPFNPQDPGEGGFDTSTVASIIAEVEGLVAAKAG